jgi:uncharacterized membrane protein
MNRTTTVVVALIAAAGLSTMVYAVPEQRALAWGGGFGGFGGCGFGCGGCGFGCGGGFFGGCGFGCGGGFFGDPFGFPIHKHIIQTISQTNDCTGNGDDQKAYGSDHQDQNQKDKQTVCLNTAVNNAGRGFGVNGVGNQAPSQGLGNDVLGQNG